MYSDRFQRSKAFRYIDEKITEYAPFQIRKQKSKESSKNYLENAQKTYEKQKKTATRVLQSR